MPDKDFNDKEEKKKNYELDVAWTCSVITSVAVIAICFISLKQSTTETVNYDSPLIVDIIK